MTTEIKRLVELLENARIPFELTDDVMGNENNQVWYPSHEGSICDVICHGYSYGGREGLLEIMGLVDPEIGDDVEGYLKAEEVFNRIRNHYRRTVIRNKFKKKRIQFRLRPLH